MTTRTRKSGSPVVVVLALGFGMLLGGCGANSASQGGATSAGPATAAPASTVLGTTGPGGPVSSTGNGPLASSASPSSVSVSAAPSSASAAASSPAAPQSSAQASATGTSGTGPTGGTAAGTTGVPACLSGALTAAVTAGDGSSASTLFPYLVLTNTGGSPCTLWGYPGVSFVGYGNGTQLGADGLWVDLSSRQTVNLAPGGSAHSRLRITKASTYPAADCQPESADGLRVYPPGQADALFAPSDDFTACTSSSQRLIMVGPMEPGAA